MTTSETLYLIGTIAIFVLLLGAMGWGMLQTQGLERPPIDGDHH